MINLNDSRNNPKRRSGDAARENVTALYERLSNDDGMEGESNSITNQKAYLENYARENGFTCCRHYTDDGYSGGNFDRPGWKQMIEDIEAGKVKTVLAKDLSRVGRNYVETGYYTEIYFSRMGVRFIAVGNGIDNARPESAEFSGFMNIMNDWYRKDIAKKVRQSLRQRGMAGKPLTTRAFFGYVNDPEDGDKWLVDPVAAETVRRIFQLAAAGVSNYEICRTLSREKRVTPGAYRGLRDPDGSGKRYVGLEPYLWLPKMICRIIRKREYLGETVNFKTCRDDSEKEFRNSPGQMVFPGTHEAIVDPETWQAAQKILHPEMSCAKKYHCVFTGMTVCGRCGVRMMFKHCIGNKKKECLTCRTNLKSRSFAEPRCFSNTVRITVLRNTVTDVIRAVSRYAVTDEDAFRSALEKEAKLSRPDERKALEKQIHGKEKRLAELELMMKKLYEDFALGHISEERFDEFSVSCEQEEEEIRNDLAAQRERLDSVCSEADRTEQFLALARKYRDCTEITDEMIRAFVEKIVVYPTVVAESGQRTRKIEVHLKFIGQFRIPEKGTAEK